MVFGHARRAGGLRVDDRGTLLYPTCIWFLRHFSIPLAGALATLLEGFCGAILSTQV